MRFFFYLVFLVSSFQSLALEFDHQWHLRTEAVGSRDFHLGRNALKPKLQMTHHEFQLKAEGFAELNSQNDLPYENNKKGRAYFQELYMEWVHQEWTFRAGQQALRWSDSWLMPSLDFWTARRLDRLFLDPLDDQLKHSTGLLVKRSSEIFDIEIFSAAKVPGHDLPDLISSSQSDQWNEAFGAKGLFRLWGLNLATMYSYKEKIHRYGFSANYAWEEFVGKSEIGFREAHWDFLSFGADIFLGDFTVFPQVTYVPVNQLAQEYYLLYLPWRMALGAHSIQMDYYHAIPWDARFVGLLYQYDINDEVAMSLFWQNYQSLTPNNLIYLYEQISGGWLLGLRIQADI